MTNSRKIKRSTPKNDSKRFGDCLPTGKSKKIERKRRVTDTSLSNQK